MGVTMHHSRSAFLTGASALLLAAPAAAGASTTFSDPQKCPVHDPVALQKSLEQGNEQWQAGLRQMLPPQQEIQRREALAASGQCPPVTVLSCSDSRVPPEVVFHRGIGDLFVARTAGNVADAPVTGSVQYAAQQYHPGLLLVLGHEKCGAIEATYDYLLGLPQHRKADPSDIGSIVALIVPAVRHIPVRLPDGKPVPKAAWMERAVRANAASVALHLARSPIVREQIGPRLHVFSGHYAVETGLVSWYRTAP
jgi:carbonic anhydrase